MFNKFLLVKNCCFFMNFDLICQKLVVNRKLERRFAADISHCLEFVSKS